MATISTTTQTTEVHRPARSASWRQTLPLLTIAVLSLVGLTGCGGSDSAALPAAAAPTAQLVKDINPGAGSSNPYLLVAGSLYFVADNGASGYELWKYN